MAGQQQERRRRSVFLSLVSPTAPRDVESADACLSSATDITGWLLKAYPKDSTVKPHQDPLFGADSRLIIVAGSDTTAATMTFLFYHLALNPAETKKIRDELRPLIGGKGDDWSDINIRDCKHLNGAINESLRLHPPVPSGVERMVPAGGAEINGTFLPPETIFWMPQYVISRGMSFSPEGYTDIGS